jgi:hypothetical protein
VGCMPWCGEYTTDGSNAELAESGSFLLWLIRRRKNNMTATISASPATPTPAPIPAFAPVERVDGEGGWTG